MDTDNQRMLFGRKQFILKSYFLFLAFILLTIGQYILIVKVDKLLNLITDHIELVLTGFVMSLILLTLFVFVENVRFTPPLNWLLIWIIMEGFILAITRVVSHIPLDILAVCLGFTSILVLICISLGTCLSHDFTLDIIIIFVLSFIFLIGAIYFVTLYVVAGVQFSFYIHCGLVAFVVCTFLMYHTQTINGGRYAELRLADYPLAALMLYIDFALLLMLSFYFVPTAWLCIFGKMDQWEGELI